MSTLRSALEEWELVDPDELSPNQLGADLKEFQQAIDWLERLRLRFLASFARKKDHVDAQPSTTAWLIDECGLTPSAARERVKVAQSLESMTATATALAQGDISFDHARVLASAQQSRPAGFVESELALLEAARAQNAVGLIKTVDYWK